MCMFIMLAGYCGCSTHAVVSHLQVNGDAFLAQNRAEFRLLKDFERLPICPIIPWLFKF